MLAHRAFRRGRLQWVLCSESLYVRDSSFNQRKSTRPVGRGGAGLLTRAEALREAEELLVQFEILYPTESLLRTAIRAVATYQLSWFDAHLWAYAEHYGLDQILSEDFSDGQLIGSVRIRNPFIDS